MEKRTRRVKLFRFFDPDTGELMDTFVFPETADIEQIIIDIQIIWAKEGGERSYKDIIIERYGDKIIRIIDKKVVLR